MITDKEIFIVLCDNDRLRKADAVVLLEGDGFNRINKACDLVKGGFADKLVFSGGIKNESYGSYPYSDCLPRILDNGIKEEQIIWESSSQHTGQQAAEVIKISQQQKWENIILVASHYHQYRAFLTFLKVLEQNKIDRYINIINAPVTDLDWFVEEPWGRRFDLLQTEFGKIEYYQANGTASDYKTAIAYFKWRLSH